MRSLRMSPTRGDAHVCVRHRYDKAHKNGEAAALTLSKSASVLGSEHLRLANAKICRARAFSRYACSTCTETQVISTRWRRTCCTAGCWRCVSSGKTLTTPSGSTSPLAFTTVPTELLCSRIAAQQR